MQTIDNDCSESQASVRFTVTLGDNSTRIVNYYIDNDYDVVPCSFYGTNDDKNLEGVVYPDGYTGGIKDGTTPSQPGGICHTINGARECPTPSE